MIHKEDFQAMIDEQKINPKDFFDSNWRNKTFFVTDEDLVVRSATKDDLTDKIETAELNLKSVKKQE